jgi:phage shock protein C
MAQPEKRLYRSRSTRVIAGICGGLADFFSLDVTLIRLLFVLGVIFGFGSLLVVYIVMLFIVPEEPLPTTAVIPPVDEPPPAEQQ